jgi:hypothetical protein
MGATARPSWATCFGEQSLLLTLVEIILNSMRNRLVDGVIWESKERSKVCVGCMTLLYDEAKS